MKLQEIMKKIEKCNNQLRDLFGKDKIGLSNNYTGIATNFYEFKKQLHREFVPAAEKSLLEVEFECFNGVFYAQYSGDGKYYYNINFYIVEV